MKGSTHTWHKAGVGWGGKLPRLASYTHCTVGFNVSFQTAHWTRRGHASIAVRVSIRDFNGHPGSCGALKR